MASKKLNPSIKVAIVGVVAILLAFGLWNGYAELRLRNVELTEIPPTDVSLVAVQPGAGYRILVSNEVAKLAEVQGDLDDIDSASIETLQADNASILPIKSMLDSMRGDEQALGNLVMRLNDMQEDDLPALREGRTWTSEDLRKVLDGDEGLRAELEADLNVRLDGTPLDEINMVSVQNGIVVDSPVPVRVSIGGEEQVLTARVLQPYQPAFTRRFEGRLETEEVDLAQERLVAIYRDLRRQIYFPEEYENPIAREDVADSIERLIAPETLAELAVRPERVLANAVTVLNQDYITGASYEAEEGRTRDVTYRLNIDLTEEGRMRMWKYSRENPDFQLLLIVDGAAIAAPVISTELRESPITITRISSERLIQNTVAKITDRTEASDS